MNRRLYTTLSFLFILSSCSLAAGNGNDLGNGFGEKFDWQTLEKGLDISKETGKPLMLIIHKSWCGACKAFKPKFAASKEALELSQNFVMVNTLDNDEPQEEKYKPDGGYIPRILFLDSTGNVREELYNEKGNPKYKFYYYDESTVIDSMKRAVEVLSHIGSMSDEL